MALLLSLLVVNSFRSHLEEGIRRHMKEMRTDIAMISGGLTSVLQPLKSRLTSHSRTTCGGWMAKGDHDLTPAGKIRPPSIDMLCRWILEVWSAIP